MLSVPPLLHGRDFTDRDARDEPGWELRSAIVNEEFVRRYLPDQEPLGARLSIGDAPDIDPRIEIVGVVRSFRDFTLREPRPHVYFPLWERSVGSGTFYVRTGQVSESAVDAIRASVRAVDPALTIVSLRTVDAQLDRLLVNERMLAVLASAFAFAATLLAVIGLYAVLSFSAARRTKEIGIRLALGAPRWSAAGLIAREAFTMAAAALAVALPLTWGLGRLIESQLFGVRPVDPGTLTQSAAIVIAVCGVATAIAARKAMAHDTVAALRLD